MSFARSIPSKTDVSSMNLPPLPAFPRLPSRLQPKRPSVIPKVIKNEKVNKPASLSETSIVPSPEDLKEIVNNLSTIVKHTEKLLTPVKQPLVTVGVRRTASLHLTKANLDRRASGVLIKSSNSHNETLGRSANVVKPVETDRVSECGTNVSGVQRRASMRSLHNVEKYSGIKCALPSSTPTMPHAFKGLEKHCTPTKVKQSVFSQPAGFPSFTETKTTPIIASRTSAATEKEKSPWRLRFEKFLNHDNVTPSPLPTESIAFTTAPKISSLNKENRTPSFRHPARRTSRFNLPLRKDDR